MAHLIVVLADGEMWTEIAGCEVLLLTEQGFAMLQSGSDHEYLPDQHILGRWQMEEHTATQGPITRTEPRFKVPTR